MYERGLLLFHRDLRVQDNVGLMAAAKECKTLYTAFIFTPEQVSNNNHYKSTNAVQFMIECLADLAKELHEKHGGELITLYGKNIPMLVQLIQGLGIECVYFNEDYTPYAKKRDQSIQDLCKKAGIECKISADYCLHAPGSIMTKGAGSKKPFHKFTPFYEAALELSVDPPKRSIKLDALSKIGGKRLSHKITLNEAKHVFVGNAENEHLAVHGGRSEGLKQLSKALRDQAHYAKTRDMMAHETSMLSAHLKFGTVSVREVYHTFLRKYGKHHELLRQLIWRDFFVHLLFFYPENLEHMYYKQYENIRWQTSTSDLEAWKSGHTGFPLVDAAMRQLNETGYMHNRGRMMVATFLVKTLLLDWREGERYFAQKLTDYDVASNLGNWQSIVGGGAYAGAWFRDMNPWIQSKKFDPDTTYIKKWIPELADVPAKDIHRWNVVFDKKNDEGNHSKQYPRPIVDYTEQKKKFFALYHKYL